MLRAPFLPFLAAGVLAAQSPTTSREAERAAAAALSEQDRHRNCADRATKAFWDAIPDERKTLSAVNKLVRQKAKAIEELRRGYYCSKCMRTASEIEDSLKIPFQSHLQQVQGVPVPAPASAIRQKAKDFDQQIAMARRAHEQVLQRQRHAQLERLQCTAALNDAVSRRQQLLVAAARLKAEEEARAEQERLAEIQRMQEERRAQLQDWMDQQRRQLQAEWERHVRDERQRRQAEAERVRQWAALAQRRQEEARQPAESLPPDIDFSASPETLRAQARQLADSIRSSIQPYRDWIDEFNLSWSTGPRGIISRYITRSFVEREGIKNDPDAHRVIQAYQRLGDTLVDNSDSFDPSEGVWGNLRQQYVPDVNRDLGGQMGGEHWDLKVPGSLQRHVNEIFESVFGPLRRELDRIRN